MDNSTTTVEDIRTMAHTVNSNGKGRVVEEGDIRGVRDGHLSDFETAYGFGHTIITKIP